ncbi:DUF3833 family protein [Planktomarina temperata]|nr:DUF3833 family protein [Planktomarina temperata]
MTHIWIRAEERPNEQRGGVTPDGVAELLRAGFQVTLEEDPTRAIPLADYNGCSLAATGSWRNAPKDAIIFGLKELPDDDSPLVHRHIMFGHAYKGQPNGARLLARFKRGGGRLYDLEYLTDDTGRRVAAFGYWAGYAGAAVALKCWAAARSGGLCAPLQTFPSAAALQHHVAADLGGDTCPKVIIIGALGRVGSGARDFCRAMGAEVTGWDMAQTAQGGPFPEILTHDIFLNCILASGTVQHREWTLKLSDDGQIQATAPDLIGIGYGQQSGATVMLAYDIKLTEEAGGHALKVTDWMYLMENGAIMNRSQFRKFGFKVAELVATMRPMPAV